MKKRYLLLSLALFLVTISLISGCGSAASSGGSAAGPTIITIYSSTDAADSGGAIFAKGSNVYALFAVDGQLMVYAKSTDEGYTFSIITKEANNVNSGGGAYIRAVVTDSGMLQAGYRGFDSGAFLGIATTDASTGTSFMNREVAGGNSFNTEGQDMSVFGDSIMFTFNDFIAWGSGKMYWSDLIGTNYTQIVPTNSYNTGNPAGGVACKISKSTSYEAVFVNTDSGGTFYQVIAALSKSTGTSFITVEVVASTTEVIKNLDIDATGEVLYVSYIRAGNLCSKHSLDGGVVWEPEHLIANANYQDGVTRIACSGNKVGIVYIVNASLNKEIWFAYSTDGGVTWGTKKLLTLDSLSWLDMYHTDNVLYLMYRTDTGIYLIGSGDFGSTW